MSNLISDICFFREMHIFGLGNPLLDITARVDDEFLEKYACVMVSQISLVYFMFALAGTDYQRTVPFWQSQNMKTCTTR